MLIIRSVFLSFTIGVLTAMLNALLGGTWLSFFSNEFKNWPEAFLLVFIFTLIFSLPGIFIFWLVMLKNLRQSRLFRSLLKAGFIISILSSMLLFVLPDELINGQQFFLSVCNVIASITSIMLHHTGIQSFFSNKRINNV